ncbi:sulfurtransferase [Cobetia sp. 14N.309.X.WAT.E.A4]|jgi:thiosulfate/3-mercaptopyruvate sulfurtransferase|uniref:sulfurtransferase n=1 Tax=Cobetia sp. 14N.309.X.WAT.E.A4 TaxID=2998323 RepID=UPI0025AF0D8D|nr:sulfurtransferase [Cobetia sp. 14N.309.X.WAT.E.A4]MDN2655081.1 sulfurtransferase [Cobetia sp. 14N.309.X.WAT.E.A4]
MAQYPDPAALAAASVSTSSLLAPDQRQAPLIDASQLVTQLAMAGLKSPVVLDCRARLEDGEAGERMWREGHLPGAIHVDMERDLSAPVREDGVGGRHPLPSHQATVELFRRLGITPEQQVVVYDDMGGQMAAARLWWMLTWAGHPDVRVLDGGIQAWNQAMGELKRAPSQPVTSEPSDWQPSFDDSLLVTAEEVVDSQAVLLDARGEARFRGEQEPVDPVAGHIPGALCRPTPGNLEANGRFKDRMSLMRELRRTLPDDSAVIAYCGSGISACQNILAFAIAGLPLPRLYAGSWSDWISDPERPVATGEASEG